MSGYEIIPLRSLEQTKSTSKKYASVTFRFVQQSTFRVAHKTSKESVAFYLQL